MEESEYDRIRRLEDSHWWYQGLWDLTLRRLAEAMPVLAGCRILDAGCGTGGLLSRLGERWPESLGVGVDISQRAMRHSSSRGLRTLVRGSVEALPFGPATFDAIVSNYVLYHRTARESQGLTEFHRVLRPGGVLLMNLPAFESLRGAHDVVVHTRRRFTREEVIELLDRHGFEPSRVTYRNTFLFPLAWVVRKLKRPASGRLADASDVAALPWLLNAALRGVLRLENRLLDHLDLPIGLSIVCEGRRRED